MIQPDLKIRILEEIKKTEQQIAEYQELCKPVAPDAAIGRVSRMDAINNKSIFEASLRQATQKLNSLQRALDKYGTPDFGICLKCKKPIPVQRILFRPESLLCVNCAQ